MSDQLINTLPQFLKGVGFDNLTYWVGGGIAVILFIVLVPELLYWSVMYGTKKQLRSLNEQLESMDRRFDRLERIIQQSRETASPLPTLERTEAPAAKPRDASFPLQH